MNKLLNTGVLFGLHMFYYACTELLINNLAAGAVGGENVVSLYGAISAAVAAGFLLFPILRRFVRNSVTQKFSLAAAWALNIAAFAIVLTITAPALFSVAAMLVTLTAGYIGGFILYSIAAGPADKKYFGRLFGIACASAILIQFGFSKFVAVLGGAGFWVQAAVLGAAISLCAVLLLFFYGELPFRPAQSEPASTPQKNMGKYLWGVFFIIAIIWSMEGVIDGVITGLHAEQAIDVSEIPRLLHAVGLVIAGFLFDYNGGKIYAPVTMLFMIGQVITVFIFTSAEGFNIALGAVYLCGAFGSVWSLAGLSVSATSSSNPALWAVMGRVAKYLPSGIMAVVGGYFFSADANIVFTAIYVALLGLLFLIFFTQGKLAVQRVAPVPSGALWTLDGIIAAHGITEREPGTLRLLLSGKNVSEIADMLESVFTQEEKKIALLLIEGETQRDICRKLHINADEIGRHIQSMRKKVTDKNDPDEKVAVIVKKYSLTGREKDMLLCLRREMTNAAIAEELVLSEDTIKIHVRNLMRKLPVSGRREVAVWVDTFRANIPQADGK